jgi:16S rRNA (cytosine1402-N4)-methyltransferase
MDVGVSSMQLDQAERGFSFRLGGPLDMRMGHDGPTAADVIARASEADLANIIYIFGEERHSRAVARAIVAARKEAPITTGSAGRYRGKWCSKPNSSSGDAFQGLGFATAKLGAASGACGRQRVLKPGGRWSVSFHSLEDRIVKISQRARFRRGSAPA